MIKVLCFLTDETAIDVLLHPVRLRIVRAFLGDAERTARDLAERLDDVPQATLYRHVKRLAEVGVLIVTSETPVRGAMERTYRLDPKSVKVAPDDAGTIDVERHLKYFSLFVASLLEDFGRYIRADDVNVIRDDVHYFQATFNAAPEEFAGFMEELKALIQRYGKLDPTKSQAQRTVSFVTLPERPTKTSPPAKQ